MESNVSFSCYFIVRFCPGENENIPFEDVSRAPKKKGGLGKWGSLSGFLSPSPLVKCSRGGKIQIRSQQGSHFLIVVEKKPAEKPKLGALLVICPLFTYLYSGTTSVLLKINRNPVRKYHRESRRTNTIPLWVKLPSWNYDYEYKIFPRSFIRSQLLAAPSVLFRGFSPHVPKFMPIIRKTFLLPTVAICPRQQYLSCFLENPCGP